MQIINNFRVNVKWKNVILKKLSILLILLITLSFILNCVNMFFYKNNLFMAYKDKLNILKVSEKENRVIFSGGSATLFGVNAELFEQKSGIKTVNMGLQALQSYDVYFSTIKKYVHEGDVVIFPLEYYAYTQDFNMFDDVGLDVAWCSQEYNGPKNLFDKLNYYFSQFLRSYTRGWDTFYKNMLQPIFKQNEKLYLREKINKFGDLSKEGRTTSKVSSGVKFSVITNVNTLEQIKKYIEEYESMGVTVVITFPPFCIEENPDNNEVKKLYDELKKYFGDRLIGYPTETMYDDTKMFYDTEYHLNFDSSLFYTEYIYNLLIQNKVI